MAATALGRGLAIECLARHRRRPIFARAAGVGVMAEHPSPDLLPVAHRHRVHHAVAAIGGEDFAQLRLLAKKTDPTARFAAALSQGVAPFQQVQIPARRAAQRSDQVALVAAARGGLPVAVRPGTERKKSTAPRTSPEYPCPIRLTQ